MEALDLGAGIVSQMDFRGVAGHTCRVDPDPRVEGNPYLDEEKVAFGESFPYPNVRFDMVFADNVLEHLAEPKKVFAEVARVLGPGRGISREDGKSASLHAAYCPPHAASVSPVDQPQTRTRGRGHLSNSLSSQY